MSAFNRIHHFRILIQWFVPTLFDCFINNIFVLSVHYIFCLAKIILLQRLQYFSKQEKHLYGVSRTLPVVLSVQFFMSLWH